MFWAGRTQYAIAGCEINTNNHGHIHAIGVIINEVILYSFFEILNSKLPFLFLSAHEGKTSNRLSKIGKGEYCLTDGVGLISVKKFDDYWLFIIAVA